MRQAYEVGVDEDEDELEGVVDTWEEGSEVSRGVVVDVVELEGGDDEGTEG
jgi:hypothetical protein